MRGVTRPRTPIALRWRRLDGKSCTSILMLIAVTCRSKKKDREKDGVEKKEMTFRQVTKEEKGLNIAVRSPIAEKRRRESEEKEKVKVGFRKIGCSSST
jgi:hypothetical protein